MKTIIEKLQTIHLLESEIEKIWLMETIAIELNNLADDKRAMIKA